MWNEVSWHGLIRLDMDMEHALFSFVIFVGKCNVIEENQWGTIQKGYYEHKLWVSRVAKPDYHKII